MFYIFAGLLACSVALVLALPFLRKADAPASRHEHDMEAYRAQLREIEHDQARSLLSEAEAENARVEVSRRLLAAAEKAKIAAQTERPALSSRIPGLTALAVPIAAFGLYAALGSPSLPDLPFAERKTDESVQVAERPSQEQAEERALAEGRIAEITEPRNEAEQERFGLIEQVQARLAEAPEQRGYLILARLQLQVGQANKAWRNFSRAIQSAEGVNLSVYVEMAEAMIESTGGYVSPEAEDALNFVLARTPDDPQTRYYKGLAEAQRGDMNAAYGRWASLLSEAKPGDPWVPLVYQRTAQAAEDVGQPIPPVPPWLVAAQPPQGPGPGQEEIAAAAEMSEEDRMAMIEGMVSGLATRLEDDPNDLQGWLRLIQAYRVMGREEALAEASQTARETFSSDEEALAALEQALN